MTNWLKILKSCDNHIRREKMVGILPSCWGFLPIPPKRYSLEIRRWHELKSNRDSATSEPAYALVIPTRCSWRPRHCRQQSLDSKGLPSETHGLLCLISCLIRRFSKGLATIETSNGYTRVHCRAIPFWGDGQKTPCRPSGRSRVRRFIFCSGAVVFSLP